MSVLVVDKGQPGREASWAAGGMLVDFPLETPPALNELAAASAQMYPQFVRCLEAESGLKIDLRSEGAIAFLGADHDVSLIRKYPLPAPLAELEPAIKDPDLTAIFLRERSVDPRELMAGAIAAAKNLGVDFSSDDAVQEVEICEGRVAGVRTAKTRFAAGIVVNCAGAWAGQIAGSQGPKPWTLPVASGAAKTAPHAKALGRTGALPVTSLQISIPTRPVKGQMLALWMPDKNLVRHVVRTQQVYLIPRSNQHLVIGATLEEAGFDKRTVPETILKLRNAAIALVPRLAESRILEDWAGLRPGTPDKLPILGHTCVPGYFVATGHYRDGILLAPVTAKLMSHVITRGTPEFDLRAFRPDRF